MAGASSSTAKTSWANLCRKATGEKLVDHKGALMTPTQKAVAAQTTGTPKDDKELANQPVPFASSKDARIEAPPTTASRESRSPPSAVSSSALQVNEANTIDPFPFFDLHFDLRQSVLSHIFPRSTIRVFLRRTKNRPATGIPFPPIVRVSQRLRAEALYLALQRTTLEVTSGPANAALTTWLHNLDFTPLHGDIDAHHIRSGLDVVQNLSFPYFSRFPRWKLPPTALNADVELMKKCKNLKLVTVMFTPGDLIDNMEWEEDLLKTPGQLVATLHMEGIVEVRVERIVLVGRKLEWFGDWKEDGIVGLKGWLVEGFEKVGRDVVVDVVEPAASDRRL